MCTQGEFITCPGCAQYALHGHPSGTEYTLICHTSYDAKYSCIRIYSICRRTGCSENAAVTGGHKFVCAPPGAASAGSTASAASVLRLRLAG